MQFAIHNDTVGGFREPALQQKRALKSRSTSGKSKQFGASTKGGSASGGLGLGGGLGSKRAGAAPGAKRAFGIKLSGPNAQQRAPSAGSGKGAKGRVRQQSAANAFLQRANNGKGKGSKGAKGAKGARAFGQQLQQQSQHKKPAAKRQAPARTKSASAGFSIIEDGGGGSGSGSGSGSGVAGAARAAPAKAASAHAHAAAGEEGRVSDDDASSVESIEFAPGVAHEARHGPRAAAPPELLIDGVDVNVDEWLKNNMGRFNGEPDGGGALEAYAEYAKEAEKGPPPVAEMMPSNGAFKDYDSLDGDEARRLDVLLDGGVLTEGGDFGCAGAYMGAGDPAFRVPDLDDLVFSDGDDPDEFGFGGGGGAGGGGGGFDALGGGGGGGALGDLDLQDLLGGGDDSSGGEEQDDAAVAAAVAAGFGGSGYGN